MMRPEEHTVTHTINRYRSFRYELILEGVIVGAIAGAVVVAFRYLIGYADTLLHSILDFGQSHPWFIPVWFLILAAAAFIVAWLLKWESLISGSGIPQIEGEIMGEIDECWWRVLLAKLGAASCHWDAAFPWAVKVPASSWAPWRPKVFQGSLSVLRLRKSC